MTRMDLHGSGAFILYASTIVIHVDIWCHFEYRLIICGFCHTYVVHVESWSPSNSIGSPSNSTGSPSGSIGSPSNSTMYMYRPTMSAMLTNLEDSGKKHNSINVLNFYMMSSDSI